MFRIFRVPKRIFTIFCRISGILFGSYEILTIEKKFLLYCIIQKIVPIDKFFSVFKDYDNEMRRIFLKNYFKASTQTFRNKGVFENHASLFETHSNIKNLLS